MNRSLMAAAALAGATVLSHAGPPPRGGIYVRPPVVYPGPPYRPVYPYRPYYPGWGVGYWRPGVVVGTAWPYPWGVPYAVPPLVVSTAPAPQVIVQPAQPADSYWYYCTQPAGYYPYVQQCGQPWMKVVPQVPGSTSVPPRLAP